MLLISMAALSRRYCLSIRQAIDGEHRQSCLALGAKPVDSMTQNFANHVHMMNHLIEESRSLVRPS
jgi:hypothetical protein